MAEEARMKTIIALMIVFILAEVSASAEETKVYDENWHLKYRSETDGRPYDDPA
jgi:hypothetical protein